MTEGIKEALYCLFRTKSNKASIPASQVNFIKFLEKEAPELIIEKKENYIDKLTKQFVPISAIVQIPSVKDLKQVNSLTLAVIFLVDGKYHVDKTISFMHDTVYNLLKLEHLYSEELKETKIFDKDFIKIFNIEEFFAIDSDGTYNFLSSIKPHFKESGILGDYNKTYFNLFDETSSDGMLPFPIAKNTFSITLNSTRMITDHPKEYFEHPINLKFDVKIEDYIDIRTGMVCEHYSIYSIIKDVILERFGSGNINLVNFPELRWRPTSELCAIYLHKILSNRIPEVISEITVSEIDNNNEISSTVDFNDNNDTNSILNTAKKVGLMYDDER
jgi:6-pyruvoyl-tetrahydropterin synthase